MKDKIVTASIEPNFAGHYRLEYDGKYITLFGWDNSYPVYCYGSGKLTDEFEEMVLISCVEEVRNASPSIIKVDENYIYIQLFLK